MANQRKPTNDSVAKLIATTPGLSISDILDILQSKYCITPDTPDKNISEFIKKTLSICQWDILPYGFLYDLYKSWLVETHPKHVALGRNQFIRVLQDIIRNAQDQGLQEWAVGDNPLHPGHNMDKPEPLILRYGLKKWANTEYAATDAMKYCQTPLRTSYKGLVRKTTGIYLNQLMKQDRQKGSRT